MSLSFHDTPNHQTHREIQAGIRPEFRSIWLRDNDESDPSERGEESITGPVKRNLGCYPLLRLRKRLLAGQLDQSANLPPLPTLDMSRGHKPAEDVDPDLPTPTEV
jgi:hypothetical protein